MFGPAFLVAPVTDAGVTQAHVYAPQTTGGWYDWWSGRSVSSGAEAAVDAPLGHVPLLVRAGSIVPLGPVEQYAGEKKGSPLELRVYPGADAHFMLYADDGTSYDYEHGQRAMVRLTWNDATGTLTIGARQGSYTGMPAQQQMHVRLLRDGQWLEKDVTYTGRQTIASFGK